MRKNDPRFAVNANWTSVQEQFGWRHFRIVERRWRGKMLEVELMAVCDRNVRFWIEANTLLDQELYQAGWHDLNP